MSDFSELIEVIEQAIKTNNNEEITGAILQGVLKDIVEALGDEAINALETALQNEINARTLADTALGGRIDAEVTARQLGDSTLQGGINTAMQAINAINNAITNGCVYAGIATPSSTPASGKVFYLAFTAGTYTNFNSLVVPQGINILKNNGSTWSLDSFLGIDDAPTPSSNKLVKSGGVFNDIMTNGSAFDLTAYNNGTTYADLNAAVTALNALPAAYKKGGMSMKYVQSSDNKYVQYRCKTQSFSVNLNDWYIYDEKMLVENPFFVEVNIDSDGKLLEARKKDGTKIEYGDLEVKGNIINEGIESTDKILSCFDIMKNTEWLEVTKDKDGRIIEGIKSDGKKYIANLDGLDEKMINFYNSLKEYVSDSEYKNILTAFDNIVSVGDSLTYCQVYTSASSSRQAYSPWPKCIKKMLGLESYTIYARAGATSKSCWNENKDLFAVPQNGKTLVTIFLGSNNWFEDTLDTSAPASEVENYRTAWADDYTGSMCKIIQTFINFGAKILIIRPYGGGIQPAGEVPVGWTLKDTNRVLLKIIDRFKCAYVDGSDIYSNKESYHLYPDLSGRENFHFNDLGYSYFAGKLLSKVGQMPSEYQKYLLFK